MKKRTALAVIASVFTLVATVVASSACWFYWYQPEEPESLSNK